MSDSLRPHESQHTRPPCPSPAPGVYSNSCPSSQWCHPAVSSSVVPFSSCPQSLPASGSFPMSQLFAWGGQSIGVLGSASVLPMNTQGWSPLGWKGYTLLFSLYFVFIIYTQESCLRNSKFLSFKKQYLCIWLHRVLVVSHVIFAECCQIFHCSRACLAVAHGFRS